MKELLGKIKNYIKLHIRKFQSAIIAALIFAVVMTVTVFAKFVTQKDLVGNMFNNNIASYYMEILGDDAVTKLSERIVVDELNPGEVREVDIYIANGNMEKVSNVDLVYEIELIHTLNMPLVYELYDSKGNLLVGDSTEDGTERYENDGSTSMYKLTADNDKMVLHINKFNPESVVSEKYTLKISWNKDDESANFKYVKEIDFLYLNVYAYQSEPVK